MPGYRVELVQRAYKFALSPTREQADQLASHAGAARYAYNWALEQILGVLSTRRDLKATGQTKLPPVPGHFDLCKMWTAHKNEYATTPPPGRDRDLSWVGEVFVGTLQAAIRDADTARKNWLHSLTGARGGRRMGAPRYKSKRNTPPTLQMHGTTLNIVDGAAVKRRTGWKWATRPTPNRPGTRVEVLLDRPAVGIKLPKVGVVGIPVRVRLPGGFDDRNRRVARSLARALAKPALPCPPCGATGTITKPARTLKDGTVRPAETVPCPTCKGTRTAPNARIIRATLSRGASGTWWCSVTAEVAMRIPTGPTLRQRTNGTVGLDLGTRYLAVTSDGTLWPNPQHLDAALAELRAAQRRLSRCQDGSRRREKTRRQVGTTHERVALLRRDSANRIATSLCRTYATVAVEGWNVQRLAQHGTGDGAPKRVQRDRNRRLADAAPGLLRNRLNLKAPWEGATYLEAPRTLETARTCPVCWSVRAKPIPLTTDMFVCDTCGVSLDRRVATARVVAAAAGGGSPVPEPPVPPKSRGGGVRPDAVRGGGRPPVKRVARTRQRGKAGTPDP